VQFMLDTCCCIDIIRGRHPAMLARLKHFKLGTVSISSITLAELEYGAEKSARPEKNKVALLHFCAGLEILPFDSFAAVAYGKIRATLEREGRVIGPLDLLIAAHALAEDVTVVTSNEGEFRRVAGLRVENWR